MSAVVTASSVAGSYLFLPFVIMSKRQIKTFQKTLIRVKVHGDGQKTIFEALGKYRKLCNGLNMDSTVSFLVQKLLYWHV